MTDDEMGNRFDENHRRMMRKLLALVLIDTLNSIAKTPADVDKVPLEKFIESLKCEPPE